MQTYVPTAEMQAGGFLQQGNAFLNDALNIWGKVEEIKATKSASGGDQQQAMVQPELANGAAVQVERPLQAPTDKKANTIEIGGVKVNKSLLMFSGVLLATAFVSKKFT